MIEIVIVLLALVALLSTTLAWAFLLAWQEEKHRSARLAAARHADRDVIQALKAERIRAGRDGHEPTTTLVPPPE